MPSIKHIWFDLDGTLTVFTPEFNKVHDKLRYDTYAKVTGRPRSKELEQEYEALYERERSNAAAFRSLGLPSDYWALKEQAIDSVSFYEPVPNVYETVERLAKIVPISIFTNSKLGSMTEKLKVINVDASWFTHVITGDDIKERKPALDGFKLAVQKSGLAADKLLFVGDRIEVDIKPAKAVGMQTCLVWDESPEADYSFPDFKGLLALFS